MRRLLALAVVLAGLTFVVAACGSREASIVDKAFQNPPKSAQVTLRVTMGRQGVLEVHGPWQTNGSNQLDSFDFTFDLANQLKGSVVSTGRNVFVRYKGETYEVGERRVARFERQMAAQNKQQPDLADAGRFGVDLKKWFPKTSVKEEAEAAGVPTTRVSGRLDLDRAVRDIARLLKRPELKTQFGQISERDLRRVARALSDPRFTLDVGRDDGKLRQLTASARIRGQGRLGLLVELRDVDKPVTIDAPEHGRPIQDLLKKLGGVTGKPQLQGA